jgi:hypothetical protein
MLTVEVNTGNTTLTSMAVIFEFVRLIELLVACLILLQATLREVIVLANLLTCE